MLIAPPLTGERTYLHGVDILQALIGATGADGALRLVLRVAGSVAIEAGEAPPSDDDPVCGEFHFRCGTVPGHLWLRHRTDRPVTHRLPGRDADLAMGAALHGDRAQQGADVPGHPLHRAVALALALLERSHPDDYWTIAEIAAAEPPPPSGAVAIELAPRLGGRFCRVEVAIDGQSFARVLLARGQPRR